MYVRIVRSKKNMAMQETLYECVSAHWYIDQDPAMLRLDSILGHEGVEMMLGGNEGETLTVYTMNNQGKTIDSRSFEF